VAGKTEGARMSDEKEKVTLVTREIESVINKNPEGILLRCYSRSATRYITKRSIQRKSD
jgi:hypothetical protein